MKEKTSGKYKSKCSPSKRRHGNSTVFEDCAAGLLIYFRKDGSVTVEPRPVRCKSDNDPNAKKPPSANVHCHAIAVSDSKSRCSKLKRHLVEGLRYDDNPASVKQRVYSMARRENWNAGENNMNKYDVNNRTQPWQRAQAAQASAIDDLELAIKTLTVELFNIPC